MADSAEPRTEKPTPKKVKDAHEKGQLARSKDLAMAISALAVIVALSRLGPSMILLLATRMRAALAELGNNPRAVLSGPQMGLQVISDGRLFFTAVAPLLAIAGFAGFMGN